MQTTTFTASEARSFLNQTRVYRDSCIQTVGELKEILTKQTEQLKQDINNKEPQCLIDSRTKLIKEIVTSIKKVELNIENADKEIKDWQKLCPPLKKDYRSATDI